MYSTMTRRHTNGPFELLRELDHALSRATGGDGGGDAMTATYPVDIHEDEDHLVVEAELPGFRKEEVDVHVEQGVLTLRAQRTSAERQGESHLNERRHTRVVRRFALPTTVDTQNVEASLQDGVLTLRMPRKQEVKPRKIEVK